MSDLIVPPESLSTEVLRSFIAGLQSQISDLNTRLAPFTAELHRRECEENPFLEKLRNGAEIIEEWISDAGIHFIVDGVDYGYDDDDDDDDDGDGDGDYLSALRSCPQVDYDVIERWGYGYKFRLKPRVVVAEGGAE